MHAWPHVSCDFGNFDIAGHPKPHSYWYSANWLQGFGETEPGRPSLPFKTVARILELPVPPGVTLQDTDVAKSASISAVTTAPFAELFLDGVAQGVLPTIRNDRGEVQPTEWAAGPDHDDGLSLAVNCTGESSFPINATGVQCHDLHDTPAESAAECAIKCCTNSSCDTWQWETSGKVAACWIGHAGEGIGKCGPPHKGTWEGGQRHAPNPGPGPSPPRPAPKPATFRNATLLALSADRVKVLAMHSLFAPSAETVAYYKLQLTLDVPSLTTGTGAALLLDGRDTALVRCAIVDGQSNDALVSTASNRITWKVVSGAGRPAGISSGNKSSHEWMKSHSVNAYLGLARGLFRVTQDCTSTDRASCATIDTDAARSPTAVKATASECNTASIVVEATAEGFAPVRISIPVSVDETKDGVMAVARATGESFADGFSYLDDFVG